MLVTTPGRPLDHSKDGLTLESTLDLLSEQDYEHVTLDEVAIRTGRAKTTLYRRWATKEALVLAAIRAAGHPPEVDDLPDRGSLREDLVAIVDSTWLGGADRRLAIFLSLASAARSSTRLAPVVQAQVTEPYVAIYRRLMRRAIERGEVSTRFSSRIPLLAEVIPAMTAHRLGAGAGPVGRDYFVSIIDDVVLSVLDVAPSEAGGIHRRGDTSSAG